MCAGDGGGSRRGGRLWRHHRGRSGGLPTHARTHLAPLRDDATCDEQRGCGEKREGSGWDWGRRGRRWRWRWGGVHFSRHFKGCGAAALGAAVAHQGGRVDEEPYRPSGTGLLCHRGARLGRDMILNESLLVGFCGGVGNDKCVFQNSRLIDFNKFSFFLYVCMYVCIMFSGFE